MKIKIKKKKKRKNNTKSVHLCFLTKKIHKFKPLINFNLREIMDLFDDDEKRLIILKVFKN